MNNPAQAAAHLLDRVSATAKSFEAQYRENGTAYNIFKVAGISAKEVEMCRVLADLLDPKGLHYQGNTYLKLFMDMVVKPLVENAGNIDLSKAKVTAEHRTDKGRRIDIVIDDGVIFIPMEVKIYAGEQEQQIADYAAFSRKMNSSAGFVPVLFLTPGWYESSEAPNGDYVPISFEKHIIPWLEKCLSLAETERAAPIRETLKQFTRAIKSFCGSMEDEAMEKAINDLVKESRDNYTAALLISKALEELDDDFDNKIWDIFKGKIFDLVKSKIPDADCLEENDWSYLYFSLSNGCGFSINYDMQSFTVEHDNPEKQLSAGTADKFRKIMSGITGIRDYDHGEETCVWFSETVRYPGLENVEEGIYKYELYQIFSKDPQAVADKIVSWVMELKTV